MHDSIDRLGKKVFYMAVHKVRKSRLDKSAIEKCNYVMMMMTFIKDAAKAFQMQKNCTFLTVPFFYNILCTYLI